MTVSLLIISHNDIGAAILKATIATFGELPLPATAVAINYNTDPVLLIPKLKRLVKDIDQGHGVLVLTDMYGSTPSNIAQKLYEENNIQIVSGLNLPMLIRVMNYPTLNLLDLAQKALSAGREGVMNCNACGDI